MAKITPFVLILLFTGVFALVMLSFTFLGNHTIYTPNQTEVQTPELNAFEEQAAEQQGWIYTVLWGLMVALLLFAIGLSIRNFLRKKTSW